MREPTVDELAGAIAGELAGLAHAAERSAAASVEDGRFVVEAPGLDRVASVDGARLLRELAELRRLAEEAAAAAHN